MKPYYQDDAVTIYHGDCREILPSLDPLAAIVTDPQYQLANGKRAKTKNRDRGERLFGGTMVHAHDWHDLQGDDVPFDPSPYVRPKRTILWGAIHYANMLPASTSWLVWDKREEVCADHNADCEMAWTNLGGPARIHRQLWKGICRRGEENIAVSGSKLHPFQKPLALMQWCLGFLPTEMPVIDPQFGSGTTLLAAKNLGRIAFGCEIEERNCEIAAKRMSQEVLAL